jgi:hypothetical protein
MAHGNTIIVSAFPQGKFLEGIVEGALYPGTLLQIKAATARVSGRYTFQALAPSGGDGKPAPIMVLTEDRMQGKLMTDVYTTLTRGFAYSPIAGEELNVLAGETAGTGNTFTIGDYLMCNATAGYLIPNSSGAAVPFQALETVTQVAASYLLHVMYTGA